MLEKLSEPTDLATHATLHKAKYRGHESRDESHQEAQTRYDYMMGILNNAIKEETREKNRQQELKANAKASGHGKGGKGDEENPKPATPGLKGEPRGKGKGKTKGTGI